MNPLRGPNEDAVGVRFLPLSDAYDLELRKRVHNLWNDLYANSERKLHEGVYAFVAGPKYVAAKLNNADKEAMRHEQNVACSACWARTQWACRLCQR